MPLHAQLQEEERAGAEALEATADQLSQEAHTARQRLQRLAGLCGHNLAKLDPAEVSASSDLEDNGNMSLQGEEFRRCAGLAYTKPTRERDVTWSHLEEYRWSAGLSAIMLHSSTLLRWPSAHIEGPGGGVWMMCGLCWHNTAMLSPSEVDAGCSR